MDPITDQQRRLLWLLFACALVILAAGMGLRDPWPSDEPRFALAARQMIQSGEWLFPHRGSELYPDKPPMLMWTQAASYVLTRSWRVAFLLPSLLAAMGTLALVYDLGRRLWNRQVGLYAAAALLISFQFVYQAKRAQIDPLVTFFITAANYGLLRHLLLGPAWRWFWFGCFCAGRGVITKGVGVIALLLLIPYAWAAARGWPAVARMGPGAWWRWLGGLIAMLLVMALWLVPMLLVARGHADNPAYAAYVDNILFHQTADRYAHAWAHHHSAFYYVPIVLFSWLPLSLAYPGLLPRWWRGLKARDARVLLPLAWVLLVLLFFSIPAGKRDVYILPALPLLALVSAPFLPELVTRRWLRAAGLVFIGVMSATLLLGGIYTMTAHPKFAAHFALERGFTDEGRSLWWMCICIGAVQLALVGTLRLRHAGAAVAGGMAALWLGWSLWATPLLNDSSSAAGLMAAAQSHLRPHDEIGLVAWKEQDLLMLDRAATDFGYREPWQKQFAHGVHWQAQAPATRWLFVQQPAMGQCVNRDKAIFLGHANRRQWWMFKANAVAPRCEPDHSGNDDSDDE